MRNSKKENKFLRITKKSETESNMLSILVFVRLFGFGRGGRIDI